MRTVIRCNSREEWVALCKEKGLSSRWEDYWKVGQMYYGNETWWGLSIKKDGSADTHCDGSHWEKLYKAGEITIAPYASMLSSNNLTLRGKPVLDDGWYPIWREQYTNLYTDEYINTKLKSKDKPTLMNKIGQMMKRLLDKETQTLVKAGFINGDLELTYEGEKALKAILFDANKKLLVEAAQEVLDENKKED